MPVTQEKSAPYAPPSAILELIQRHRQRGLPSPVTGDVLLRAGISESLVPRTIQALLALDLIDEQGKPTQALEELRKAPEGEYKDRLSEWLKSAYADVLKYVDPAVDDEIRVRDAFRNYNPIGQQPRMVILFLGLATAAGMAGEKPTPQKRPRIMLTVPRKASREADGGSGSAPKGGKSFAGGGGGGGHKFYGGGGHGGNPITHLPPPLAGLLSSLPPDGGSWSQARRDKFVETFGAVIDFCYRVEEDAPSPEAKQDHALEEEDV